MFGYGRLNNYQVAGFLFFSLCLTNEEAKSKNDDNDFC